MGELPLIARQFLAIKRELPAGISLFFKMGDFYETFGEDALVSSPICGTTLSRRGEMPMTGFPCYDANPYLRKFARAGKTIALAEEVEDYLKRGRNVPMRYEVTRIVTPTDETINERSDDE